MEAGIIMTMATVAHSGANTCLYPSGMVKRILLSVQALRRQIGQLAEAVERGEHVVLSKHGKPFAVTVPIEWYRQAAAAMNDPTEY
jgi:prevent-host-death family protein